MKRLLLTLVAFGIIALSPTLALSQSMPGMTMPTPKTGHVRSEAMMTMPSSIDLNDSMSQEASGTAWLPASSPMYGKMFMQSNGDMLMVHGAIMPRFTDVGSKRGDRRFDAPNWGMAMYSHSLGANDQIGLRVMMSLDPITEGGYGYPLLFQTGETWHQRPLHDRQHPHDLFDEVAATYSHLLGGRNSVYLYVADPGEPALGPPTYMHRLLAYDYPDAPIGHHWQDATHITFGVATVGFNFGSKLKLEASDFTGREPNEDRYNFDKPRWDSASGRLSYSPNADNAYQVSYGFIKNAEGDGANQHRMTASWLYNKPLGGDSNFTTALVWGQNDLTTEGRSNSFLAEADYQAGSNTYFTRIENIQKSGHELVLPAPLDTSRKYTLGEYTLGYVRDLTHGKGLDTGLGFAVTANTKPSALDSVYGMGTPVSFEIYLRLRPSRLGGGMGSMKMAEMPPTPSAISSAIPSVVPPRAAPAPEPLSPAPSMPIAALPASQPTTLAQVTIASVKAFFTPNLPKARQKNSLAVTLTGSDGKPFVGASIRASVAMVTMDMGTTHPVFTEISPGTYVGTVAFSMSGPWRVALQITQPGGIAPVAKSLDVAVGR